MRKHDMPPIVCLCGSTRFLETFFDAGWQCTLNGEIVLSIGVCRLGDAEGGHGGEALGKDIVERLDELHLRKIDLADKVYILNVNGYIGYSTSRELAYAIFTKKPVTFLEPMAGEKFMEENARKLGGIVAEFAEENSGK